ncbi:MAG: oligosaccharide flippase family protein, partial [Syntrophaceae bacterium]|nr:oligosaccharide flippase family protein [Syntrophaceae bacterium]
AAKFLSPYDFGVFNYVLAVIFFLILFGDFGISVAASKYVAEYQATDPEKLRYVLFNSGLVILVLTILAVVVTALFGPGFLQDRYLYVLYILPLIFLAPMTSLYDGIYRGLKRFRQLAVLSTGVSILSLGFIYPLIREYGLTGALVAQNLFYLFLFLTLALAYRDFRFRLHWETLRAIGLYALLIGVIHISAFLYSRVDILVLGSFGLIEEISYYELVNKVLLLMQLPFLVYAQVQAPDIVAAYCRKGSPVILRKLTSLIVYGTSASILLALLLGLAIPWVLPRFLPAYNLPVVLWILYLFLFLFIFQNVSNLVGNTFIISTGHARINMFNIIVFGFLNLLLDILLVRRYGYLGIAYAKLFVVMLGSLSLITFYRVSLKRST